MVNSRATALYKLMDSILKMGLGLVEEITGKIVSGFKLNYPIMVSQENNPFGIDTSIEGMNSQEFSVAIFYFLVAAIAIFTIFVFMFMFKDRTSKLKTGERIMFIWILMGIVAAVAFGATQMLHGYLF